MGTLAYLLTSLELAGLAFLRLGKEYAYIPWLGACLCSLCTPIGMAIGLGVREGLNMSSGSASIASGILDAVSSGILLYTALVELIVRLSLSRTVARTEKEKAD